MLLCILKIARNRCAVTSRDISRRQLILQQQLFQAVSADRRDAAKSATAIASRTTTLLVSVSERRLSLRSTHTLFVLRNEKQQSWRR